MTRIKDLPGAQGDVLFRRIPDLPEGLTVVRAKEHIVAHSETGHHHIAGVFKPEALAEDLANGEVLICRFVSNDPLISYLECGEPIEVVHHRDYDTHAPLVLEPGIWEVRRQREYTPEGWRRVED